MLKLTILNKPKELLLKCKTKFPDVILANLQEKEVTPSKEIQEVIADKPYDGLSKVIVDKIPEEYIIPVGIKEIETNGNYDVREYANASVNVEPVLQEKTVTPSKNMQEVVADDSYYGLSKVIVNGDENLIADNIKQGTTIFGVNGTMAGAWDTSQIRITNYMFRGNKTMTEAPYFNTENVTEMTGMFSDDTNLEIVPNYNTSNVITFNSMHNSNYKLKEIPHYDTGKCTNFYSMFQYCYNITVVPELDTSNGKTFGYFLNGCQKVTTIPLLDFSKATQIDYCFQSCSSLVDLGGFKNLGQAYFTAQPSNYSYYKLNLSASTKLTHDSLMNVINNLYDIATAGVKTQQLVLGSTNLAKLTAEEINVAVLKGWSVS